MAEQIYYAIKIEHACGVKRDYRLITEDRDKANIYMNKIKNAYNNHDYMLGCVEGCVITVNIVDLGDIINLDDDRNKDRLVDGKAYACLDTYYDFGICNVDFANLHNIEYSEVAAKLHDICPNLLSTNGKKLVSIGSHLGNNENE